MADWRQIQVRIRKAKAGGDAVTKLTQLFDKTRDGMVAFELASQLEREQRIEEAVEWYGTAAQRFRRADWRKKAEDAQARLRGEAPVETPAPAAQAAASEPPAEESVEPQPSAEAPPAVVAAQEPKQGRRRRRGRRGGRGRRRGRQPSEQRAAVVAPTPVVEVKREPAPPPDVTPGFEEPERGREVEAAAKPSWQPTVRAGEPALASRLAKLESQLRRLIASPTHALDQIEEAPAGPGVLLLSDADQVNYYYIEACQTLRIALTQLAKSGRGGRQEKSFSLKSGMAEHLGISEAKVKDYLKKHCVVRWLQLDEGASHLAHFAIAVLQPVLNE